MLSNPCLILFFLPSHVAVANSATYPSHIFLCSLLDKASHLSPLSQPVKNTNGNADSLICNILGIAHKVNKSYISVTNRYQQLALSNKWLNPDGSVWPISQKYLLAYIAAVHKSISPTTLLSYLSALTDKHALMGTSWDHVQYHQSIIRTLNLIKRSYVHKPTKKAEIITRTHLYTINNYELPDTFDTLLFRAVAFVAFYGLARLGELIQASREPTHNTLDMKNMTIHSDANPPCILIQLSMAKTRNSAFPDILVIHQSFDDLCPIQVISSYIKARLALNFKNDSQFLFAHKDDSLVNKR